MGELSLGGESEQMSVWSGDTTWGRRSETRRPCGVLVIDFMQRRPGAVENEVGVVPP